MEPFLHVEYSAADVLTIYVVKTGVMVPKQIAVSARVFTCAV